MRVVLEKRGLPAAEGDGEGEDIGSVEEGIEVVVVGVEENATVDVGVNVLEDVKVWTLVVSGGRRLSEVRPAVVLSVLSIDELCPEFCELILLGISLCVDEIRLTVP